MMSDAPPLRFGRFEVIDVLGRGAMGVVYRAEGTTLDRVVAIKTIALGGTNRDERSICNTSPDANRHSRPATPNAQP